MYLPVAIDLASRRTRELELRAQHMDLIALASLAGRIAPYGDPEDPGQPDRGPRRPGRVRAIVARPVRALSDVSHALSEVACAAAVRIEGETSSR